MGLKQIKLPKQYEYKEGVTNPLYKQYHNWNKVSYSQWTSFKDYKLGYLQNYLLGLGNGESGIFANFGSDCGDFLNPYDDRTDGYPLLSDEDRKLLETLKNAHPKDSQFEYEILINLEPFGLEKTCIQAFTDRQYLVDGKLNVNDYKTLTIKTKRAFYESEDYKQLSVYGYGLEELGFSIGEMYVVGLGRSGNTTEKGNKNVLRLSGEIIQIDKPYDREKSKKVIQSIADDCLEIAEYLKVYQKYFGETRNES